MAGKMDSKKKKNSEEAPFNVKRPWDYVHALGIHFSDSKKVSDKLNFFEKLDVLQKAINNWKRRIDFTLMHITLKSFWKMRFPLSKNSAWTVTPNEATIHLGCLSILSTCNCNSNDINIKELPLF